MEIPSGIFDTHQYEMLISGLDELIRKGVSVGDLMPDIITVIKTSSPDPDKMDPSLIKEKIDEKINERKVYLEDVRLLLARLIQIKRFLAENAGILQTYDILSNLPKTNIP